MGLARLIPERRAIDASRFGVNADGWGSVSLAGVNVDEEAALSLSTFFSCVLLRAEALQSMPVDAYRSNGDLRVPESGPRWLRQPNAETLWPNFISSCQWSLDLDGNVYIAVTRNGGGQVVELWLLDHTSVEPRRDVAGGPVVYYVNGRPYNGEIRHIWQHRRAGQLKGVNRIKQAADTIGVGVAAQSYAASWFGSGSVPPGVIESPEPLDAQQVKMVRETWVRAHAGRIKNQLPGVLTGGATYKAIQVDPETAQLLGSRAFTAGEVASMMGVPGEFVGVGATGSGITYQNIGSAWTNLIRRALMSPMTVYEWHFSELMSQPLRMRFRPDVFMKPDTAGRADVWQKLIASEVLLPDEVRAFEDWGPRPDGGGMTPRQTARDLSLVEAVQKVYLGVGSVLSSDEARKLLNDMGADLPIPGDPSPPNA